MKIDFWPFMTTYFLIQFGGWFIVECAVNKLHMKIWKWLTTFPPTYKQDNK